MNASKLSILNLSALSRNTAALLLASVLGLGLAGSARAQVTPLADIGVNPPNLGANDISQFVAPTAPTSPDGLNYYVDNASPPAQTFTTGNNVNGYKLTSLSLLTAGNSGNGIPATPQAYRMRFYYISGTTAILLTTYTSAATFVFTNLDWLQWTGLTNALLPRAQYAYSFAKVTGTGYENMANVTNNPYAGGEVALIPTGGGTISLGASHNFDATFAVGLSPITSPYVPAVTNWVYDTANYTSGITTPADVSITGNGSPTTAIGNVSGGDNGGTLNSTYFNSLIDGGTRVALANVGDSISLTGNVTLSGSVNASGDQQFRLGLFNQGSNLANTNWLGYYIQQGSSGSGVVYAQSAPNVGVYASGASAVALVTNAISPGAWGAGTYSFSLTVTLLAGGAERVQWSLANGGYNQSGTVTNSNTATATTSFDHVGIALGASLGASSITLDNVQVTQTLQPLPIVVTTAPASLTVAVGQPANFSIVVMASQPTYQWYTAADASYGSATAIGGATAATYSIPSPTTGNATNYFVVVSSPASQSITSAVVSLTVRTTVNSIAWLGTTSFNWDTTTVNWSNTVSGVTTMTFQPGDNVLFDVTGKNASNISLASALFPSSLTYNSVSNYTFAGNGSIGGGGPIVKNGAGIFRINNNNAGFTGPVTVNDGILRFGNAAAFGGATNSVTVNSGGTIDINGTAATLTLDFKIQGNGYTNGGALANFSATAEQNGNGIRGLTLLGDATISAQGRWDLNGDAPGSLGLRGNNHNLTKIGSGSVFFIDASTNASSALADITILGGNLGFQGNSDTGDPTKKITVQNNASVSFFGVPVGYVVGKSLVFSNGNFNNSSANNITLSGPVTLLGNNAHTAGFQETASMIAYFNGPISGTGGFAKSNPGQDTFNGTNTYSGPTAISAGALQIGPNSSLGNSSLISVSGGALLDATLAAGGLTLGAGQTLVGGTAANSGFVYGNVTNGAGSSLSGGINGNPGLLTVNGALAMNNATNVVELGNNPLDASGAVNSFIQVNGDLALSGVNTIRVVPVSTLNTTTPYSILLYGGTFTGGRSNLTVVSANPRFAFSVIDPSTTVPFLQLGVSGTAQPLLWKGGVAANPTIWNYGTTNWLNTLTSLRDQFYDGDQVVFDDTALTNLVTLAQTNAPATVNFNNNTLNYTLSGNGTLTTGTLQQDGAASVTIALSNNLTLSSIIQNNGRLIFNHPTNATLATPLSDDSFGLGTIVQASTNTLTLTGNNSLYNGTIVVNNGVLRYNSTAALGSGINPLYITNGTGTLFFGTPLANTGAKVIHIKGAGFNGQGALAGGAGGGPVLQMTSSLILDGDATIGANPRWDFATGSVLDTGTNTLTKTGTADIWLIATFVQNMANVRIAQGVLGFQQGSPMGDPTKTITVDSNATCGFWDNGTVIFDKTILLSGSATIASGGPAGASNNFGGTIVLAGTNNNTLGTASADLFVSGRITGTGGFTKTGANTLWLFGTNTYSGPTVIGGNSAVRLGTNSSLGASSLIEIDGGSTLDVSQPPVFNLGSGQTMVGNGTVVGGNVTFGSGATLAVGFSGTTSTLTMNGNLSLQAGSTDSVRINKTTAVASDRVTGLASVSMGGALVITNIGVNALAGGDAIKLFNATTYTGNFSTIVPATPGPGLVWDLSTLHTDGTLRVVATVNPTPVPISQSLSGNQLTLSWPADHTGWTLQAQTNGLNVGISTNWVNVAGSSATNLFILTVNPANGAVFYRMAY